MSRKVFINIPVKDLDKSKSFYEALGFSINPQFSDETGACVVISEEIYAMLLTHPKFLQFVPADQKICDTSSHTEALLCLSCDSREEVDKFVQNAIGAGGRTYKEPQDGGFYYGHCFQDPDGHIWELMHMDMSAIPADPSAQEATV